MSTLVLQCDACGKKTKRSEGYADAMKNIFCTKECYYQSQGKPCIVRYNLFTELAKQQLHAVFYQCSGLRIEAQYLPVGSKIEAKDGEPETKVILLVAGTVRITTMQDDQSFNMDLIADSDKEADKNIIVLPRHVSHTIENIGNRAARLYTIYHQ